MRATARVLRVASRASRLAMAQTQAVVEMLRRRFPEVAFEIVPVTTQGDVASRRWADEAGSDEQGLPSPSVGAFVKELEHALLEGRCDLAVHSLKDVPTDLPDGLTLAAFPQREDPRDVLVLPAGAGDATARHEPRPGLSPAAAVLAALPEGATVGTSSQRRWVQLRLLRGDLAAVAVRGNVETRLRRLDEGLCHVLVLAGAGLRRLGLEGRISAWLEPDEVVPAAGQGTLAVECRADDPETLALLQAIDRPDLRAAAEAERAFLARTEAGCRWPVGAWARVDGEALELVGFAALPAAGGAVTGAGAERPVWVAVRKRRRFELVAADRQSPARLQEAARRAGEALAEEVLARIRAGEGIVLEAPGGV